MQIFFNWGTRNVSNIVWQDCAPTNNCFERHLLEIYALLLHFLFPKSHNCVCLLFLVDEGLPRQRNRFLNENVHYQYTHQQHISDYIIDNYDHFSANFPDLPFVLLDDFNRFNTSFITSQISLNFVLHDFTRNSASLDKIFSTSSVDMFTTQVSDPLANSDHNKVQFTYNSPCSTKKDDAILYDFRFSHLHAFNSLINSIDFDIVFTPKVLAMKKFNCFMNILLTLWK